METLNRWTVKRLFLTAVFAAATFAASFALGNAITLTLGPGTSGIATIIVTTVLVVICARLVETPGVFTLIVTLFTVMAIPTNLFGPPGPHKILIGLLTGLTYDLVWNITGRRRFSLPIAAALATAVSILLIFGLMTYLHHPRADYLKSVLKYIGPMYALFGFLGGVIGNWIYDHSLSRLSVVQQLKS
jgi:ABC-type thiamin/hydroxymethylpyrimidine transport system permease subunit